MAQQPTLAAEMIAQRLNTMGCINPNEATSAEAAATAIVAQLGVSAAAVAPAEECTTVYNQFKAGHACARSHHKLAATAASLMSCAGAHLANM